LAFGKSGISNDPVADVKMSEKWLNLRWGKSNSVQEKEENIAVAEDSGGTV
jgi:hypothetical protein